MYIPKSWLYENKKKLTEFGVNTPKSPNQILYTDWLLSRVDLRPSEPELDKRLLDVFNEAYYLTTLVLVQYDDINIISNCLSRTHYPSVVMPMVYYYLSRLKKVEKNIEIALKRILILMEASAKERGWEQNLADIKDLEGYNKKTVDVSTFSPVQISPKLLSMTSFNFYDYTDHFRNTDIKQFFKCFAHNSEEVEIMAEAILNSVSKLDGVKHSEMYLDAVTGEYVNNIFEAARICKRAKEDPERFLQELWAKTETITKVDKSTPRNRLQDILNQGWFDKYSKDKKKYTKQWRDQMVEDLMETEYGTEIAMRWSTKERGKSQTTKIKMGLVGALHDLNVIKGVKSKIVADINVGKYEIDTLSGYMRNESFKHYKDWLSDYLKQK